MHRLLIVAKILPDVHQRVAEIFAESDLTELPTLTTVRHRSLYRLDDLYVHLMETAAPGIAAIERVRQHPEFIRVSEQLRPYVSPYLATWRAPRDAVARHLYQWDARALSAGQPS